MRKSHVYTIRCFHSFLSRKDREIVFKANQKDKKLCHNVQHFFCSTLRAKFPLFPPAIQQPVNNKALVLLVCSKKYIFYLSIYISACNFVIKEWAFKAFKICFTINTAQKLLECEWMLLLFSYLNIIFFPLNYIEENFIFCLRFTEKDDAFQGASPHFFSKTLNTWKVFL